MKPKLFKPGHIPGYVPTIAATARLEELVWVRQKYAQKSGIYHKTALIQWIDERIDYLKTRQLLGETNGRENTF